MYEWEYGFVSGGHYLWRLGAGSEQRLCSYFRLAAAPNGAFCRPFNPKVAGSSPARPITPKPPVTSRRRDGHLPQTSVDTLAASVEGARTHMVTALRDPRTMGGQEGDGYEDPAEVGSLCRAVLTRVAGLEGL